MNLTNRSILQSKIALYFKITILSLLVLYLYYPQIIYLVDAWWNKKEFSHGFLIPVISGYIIWTKRKVLKETQIKPDARGFIVFSAGILMLIVGYIGFEDFLKRFSFVITIIGLIYIFCGKKIIRILLFPLCYLFFMIPPPHIIMKSAAVGLKSFSAIVTYKVLNFVGFPIFRDGVNLELPNITLVVADFCTGILSIIAITAVAVVYAYFTQKNMINKIVLIVLAVPIAILGNIVRLVVTVGLAYYFGDKVLDSVIHQLHGTFNFMVTIIFLVVIGNYLKRIEFRRKETITS